MVFLGENYRCQAYITASAGKVISHNQERFAKEIIPLRPAGKPVDIRAFAEPYEENETIAQMIRHMHEDRQIPYGEIAVLFRTNTQARMLLEKLSQYNIPFRMQGTPPILYRHWIARDIFSYIRIAQGSRERKDYLQILNRPNRYISRDMIDSASLARPGTGPQFSLGLLRRNYEGKRWMQERLDHLELHAAAQDEHRNNIDAQLQQTAGQTNDLQRRMEWAEEGMREAGLLLPSELQLFNKKSYSQAGEDAILMYIFVMLGVPLSQCNYLDLGANHPCDMSNTWFFYQQGATGILVDANPKLAEELRRARPKDQVINACVGPVSGEALDFHVLSADGLSAPGDVSDLLALTISIQAVIAAILLRIVFAGAILHLI